MDQIPTPSETNENRKRLAFKKYTEDLAAAKKKVEADVLQSIKEEMPSELYDAYIATIGRIPIWERTMMATYLMNYWGMEHCVHPNNNKKQTKRSIILFQRLRSVVRVSPSHSTCPTTRELWKKC
jgi:hypothetical protein